MSERGLTLAIQRLHDDPGFTELVRQDPQHTLGIYDLDENEHQAVLGAIMNRDTEAMKRLAATVGIDWTSQHLHGLGALDDSEVSTERAAKPGIKGPGALPGDGYEGVTPGRPAGT